MSEGASHETSHLSTGTFWTTFRVRKMIYISSAKLLVRKNKLLAPLITH